MIWPLCLSLLATSGPLDTLSLGVPADETAHRLVVERGEVVNGLLNLPARRLLPLEPVQTLGGRMGFEMVCDPAAPTYLTARFDGGEKGEEAGRLMLFCEGQQVGWQHLGDVDPLCIAASGPVCPGAFYYKTLPLPRHLTAGRSSVHLEIRAMGRIWDYGANPGEYYKPLEKPTRAVGRLYTHLTPHLEPPADEPRCQPAPPPRRAAPGAEAIDQVKQRLNRDLARWIQDTGYPELLQLTVLARAYRAPWSVAHDNPALIRRVVAIIDELCRRFAAEPKMVETEPKWRSFGPAGYAIAELAGPLRPYLDEPLTVAGRTTQRGVIWSDALAASLTYRQTHRPGYTNQAMISDMNLYLSNRGLMVVFPARAMPEEQARRYVREAVGVLPWVGNDLPGGGSAKPLGDSYFQTTRRGLTRELGFVGGYGEVLDWVAKVYDATCVGGADGDPMIREHLATMVAARAPFRYPGVDEDGHRTMLLETAVGWRDGTYPGTTTYLGRAGWESSPAQVAALLGDGPAVSYLRQQMEDNQYFASLGDALHNGSYDASLTLIGVPDDYSKLVASPAAEQRLPMSGAADFVWADEQDGVVAVKVGERRLYASLFWRARYGINRLARVHDIQPTHQTVATVWQDCRWRDSGLTYTFENWCDKAFTRWQHNPPGNPRQAMAGQTVPIAAVPPGMTQPPPGQENPFIGRATFYTLRYDNLTIAMNTTGFDGLPPETFELPTPAGAVRRLPSGTAVTGPLTVPPASTVVLINAR